MFLFKHLKHFCTTNLKCCDEVGIRVRKKNIRRKRKQTRNPVKYKTIQTIIIKKTNVNKNIQQLQKQSGTNEHNKA